VISLEIMNLARDAFIFISGGIAFYFFIKYKEAIKDARHDDLTGLKSRNEFLDSVELCQNSDHALAIIDVDDFKYINDNYGHTTGDRVLKMIGQVLYDELSDAKVGRLGGDEFGVVADISFIEDNNVFDDIKNKIQDLKFDIPCSVTISVGYTAYSSDYDTIREWLNEADLALYVAKDNGKNKVVKY
jgi:diguanylate cyclase (GGDEF)-like protein